VVLEIEAQGARQVREALPDAVTVFIAPPSLAVLRERLAARGTDTPEQVERRLETAAGELKSRGEFGYVVINDTLAQATDQLVEIVRTALAKDAAADG
jgi:guanylate kinase